MKSLIVSLNLLVAVSICYAGDDASTYVIPKDHPSLSKPDSLAPASALRLDVAPAPLLWTIPDSWKELQPTSIRIGNFLIPGKDNQTAQVAITSFPGSVGTELDNVNRWRQEVGQPPIDQSQISSEPITIDSIVGKLYDVSGASGHTIVASLPRNDATWFFKLRGDKTVVDSAKPAFLTFLKSVHFSTNATESQSAGIIDSASPTPHDTAPSASDPHAGLAGIQNPPTDAVSGPSPQWTAPPNWTEKTASAMVLKSFVVSDNSGHQADVKISVFPGAVGGTLANVNRWRGQMGLPPVQSEELTKVTEPIRGLAENAVLVDLTGKADAVKGSRLVAAMVPHGDSTWFYKLTGDETIVATEKDRFVKFVQTVRYPDSHD